ncbi:hypothetical protein HC891_00695 [Candidatus Gracilibacteria bacterium]|nr:hypothetical protein [Candidatus Gracilibacteria bacterium]
MKRLRHATTFLVLFLLVTIQPELLQGQSADRQHIFLPIVRRDSTITSAFGLEMSQISDNHGLPLVISSQTKWVRRNGLKWKDIERTKGNFTWDVSPIKQLEQEMIRAAAHDLNLILIVRGNPDWAVAPHTAECAPINEQHFARYAAFMAELVKRYSVPPYNVRYWEIGNEPDAAINNNLYPFGCWGVEGDPYYGGAITAKCGRLSRRQCALPTRISKSYWVACIFQCHMMPVTHPLSPVVSLKECLQQVQVRVSTSYPSIATTISRSSTGTIGISAKTGG